MSFTDQEEYITAFAYLTTSHHHLESIQDPRGIQPVRNEYDDEGKLLRHIDAYGNTIEYNHNLETRQEIITQRNRGPARLWNTTIAATSCVRPCPMARWS